MSHGSLATIADGKNGVYSTSPGSFPSTGTAGTNYFADVVFEAQADGVPAEQLSYDAQSRLVQVTLGSPVTETITLAYNAFGQRASYTVTPAGKSASLVESFKYQGDQLAQVAYSGSSIPTPYTDTYLYTQDGVPLELLRQAQGAGTATVYYYVVDGQGNVVALTDQSGTVKDNYRYDQWGAPLSISESVPQQLRYAGYWYDNELAWYWLSVRAYDPVLERFLQPDPSELEGLFSYVYVGDSPSDAADPSGLLVITPLTSGVLLTGHLNFESNVAVNSVQWGNELGTGSTPIGGELGWYWLSVRAYDPVLERFLQPDPSELEGLFSYVYAGDNPSDAADPSGLLVITPLTSGVLLTGHLNFESNVAVNSVQWGDELGTGSQPIGGELGAYWLALIPGLCGGSAVCMASLRADRAAAFGWPSFGGFDPCQYLHLGPINLCAVGQNEANELGPIAAQLGMTIAQLCEFTGVCSDIDTIKNNPNPFAKLIAFADLALWLPGLDEEKAPELLGEKIAVAVRAAANVVGCALCFPAGTLVATPHGEQAIQTLKVGDQVLAEDPTTGKVTVARVQAVLHDPASQLIAVELSDGSSIKVTADHPFWVDKGIDFLGPGWLPAGQLLPGDQLRTADGRMMTVVGLRYHEGTADVYTLTVADDHDFFVGSAQVLVHNALCGKIVGTIGLEHSFDRHAAEWFGRQVSKSEDLQAWQAIIENAAKSNKTFEWSLRGPQGPQPTVAAFARIEGKPFLVQFWLRGPLAGELADAFVPNQSQLSAIYALLKARH